MEGQRVVNVELVKCTIVFSKNLTLNFFQSLSGATIFLES